MPCVVVYFVGVKVWSYASPLPPSAVTGAVTIAARETVWT